MSDLKIGSTLDGLYRLDRLLGVGGVGSVYAAWHLNLGRPVAVKVLHPQFAQHQEPLQRFLREAQLLSKLGHESFVTVYDFSYSSATGMPYLVLELVEGENLRTRLSSSAMTIDETLALFRPLCEALGKAHQQHILHRDLKPDNLMLTPAGMVKILDFGMAKLMSDEVPLTMDKVVMGTPYYMAPERARGSRVVEPTSDVFSLGAILYEALTRRMAFGAETPLAAMYKVIRDPVAPLNLPNTALSGCLDAVIAKACAKDPRNRYQTAPEMGAALEEAIKDTGVQAPRPPSPTAATAITTSVGPTSLSVPPRSEAARQKSGVAKAGVFHGTVQFVRTRFGEDGFQQMAQYFGAERMQQILATLPTEWIGLGDLHDLHLAMSQLFDDGQLGVFRELGRFVAEATLESVYRAFLRPGDPEMLIRRSQIILDVTGSGHSRVERINERSWRIEYHELEGLSPFHLAAMVGWMQCYLEKAGATLAEVRGDIVEQSNRLVGIITLVFDTPAQ